MDKLTEITIRQAKPKLKQYKLFDGGGMFLLVHPNGSKYWRMKFNNPKPLMGILVKHLLIHISILIQEAHQVFFMKIEVA